MIFSRISRAWKSVREWCSWLHRSETLPLEPDLKRDSLLLMFFRWLAGKEPLEEKPQLTMRETGFLPWICAKEQLEEKPELRARQKGFFPWLSEKETLP